MTRLVIAALVLINAALIGVAVTSQPLRAPLSDNVYLEDLTWLEVRELIASGRRTAIVPTGGTEQNGVHMLLGKHNYIVRHTAGLIAHQLGDALVAPVIAYVPEGDVAPPSGHMTFAGTISVPETVFAATLEAAARSLHAHGFATIYFLGDSGGNQKAQAEVASKLNAEWRGNGRAVHLADYYAANGQAEWLKTLGETEATIGTHAGIRDTAELLAIHPEGIRPDMLAPRTGLLDLFRFGSNGDPTRASVERGDRLVQLKVEAALRQIRAETAPAKGR